MAFKTVVHVSLSSLILLFILPNLLASGIVAGIVYLFEKRKTISQRKLVAVKHSGLNGSVPLKE